MEAKTILIIAGSAVVLLGGSLFGINEYKKLKAEEAANVKQTYELTPYEGELEEDTFYIKSGDKIYKSYIGDTNIESKHAIADFVDEKRYLSFSDDEVMIPTVFSDDELIYHGNTDLSGFTWERFKDNGWSVGISSLKLDDNGRVFYSTTETKVNKSSSIINDLQKIQLPAGSSGAIIDKVNDVTASENILSATGTIIGLEKDQDVKLDMYVGTTAYEINGKADTHYMTSFELYESTEYELTQNGYAVIKIPDYFMSGYYLINGKTFFRYVDNPRDEGIPEDLSVPYYYEENGKRYTYPEYMELHGEKINTDDNADLVYSFDVESGKKSTISFSYISKNNDTGTYMKPAAVVISPEGESLPVEMGREDKKNVFSIELDGTSAGRWQLRAYNINGSNYEIDSKKEIEEIKNSAEEEIEKIDSEATITVTWNPEAEGIAVLTSPTGTELSKTTNSELISVDEAGKTVFAFTSLEGGKWTARVDGENVGSVKMEIAKSE